MQKMMLLATLSILQDVILRQHTKFDKNPPIHGVEMAV